MTSLLLLPLWLLPAAEPAEPVALVAAFHGDVVLQRGQDKMPLKGDDPLLPRDRLRTGKDGSVSLLILADGHHEQRR